jgi:hypothetical protein
MSQLTRKGLSPVDCLSQFPLPLEAVQELFAGNKIRAIKKYRAAYVRKFPLKANTADAISLLGLKEAKEAVDWFIGHIGPYVCTFDVCEACNGVGVHQEMKIDKMAQASLDALRREEARRMLYDDDEEQGHDVPF